MIEIEHREHEPDFAALTPQDHRTMQALIRLGHYKAVAEELGVGLQNIKNRVSSVRSKLDAESGLQAAVLYDRWLRQ